MFKLQKKVPLSMRNSSIVKILSCNKAELMITLLTVTIIHCQIYNLEVKWPFKVYLEVGQKTALHSFLGMNLISPFFSVRTAYSPVEEEMFSFVAF